MARRIVLAGIALALAALLALAFGHGRLIGLALEGRLAERGIECSGLVVSVGWDLRSGEVGDTTCDVGEGPIASASVVGPVAIVLPGPFTMPPRSLHLPAITLNPRGLGPDDDPGALGLAVLAGEVPPRLGEALLALGTLAGEAELPDVDVDQISVGRGRVLLLDRVSVRRREGTVSITADAIGPPPRGLAPLSLVARLEHVVIAAREGAVDVNGELLVEAEVSGRAHAILLDLERRVRFHLESRGEAHRLRFDDEGAIGRLRERLALAAEREGRLGELVLRLRGPRE